MNIVLVGIYALGALALNRLLRRGFSVGGIVTKPDTGPGQTSLLSLARQEGLPVLMPESPRDRSFLDRVEALKPDLIAVAGYHRRLPLRLLHLPPLGVLNTHLSLLPRYRGPCPWKWAIIRGEAESGVTIHEMTEGFDQGALLAQRGCLIEPDDTGESLFQRLSVLGADTLADVVQEIDAGTARPCRQDEALATYFRSPSEEETRIRWDRRAGEIRDLVRGLHPRPGAWTTWGGNRIRIRKAALGGASEAGQKAGTILGGDDGTVRVATGDGVLTVQEWEAEAEPIPAGVLPRHPFA